MEEKNPFASPNFEDAEKGNKNLPSGRDSELSIVANLVMSQEYYLVALQRFRQQSGGAGVQNSIRFGFGFFLILLGLLLIMAGSSRAAIGIAGVAALVLLTSPLINRWFEVRNFRKNPEFNLDLKFVFSDMGMEYESPLSTAFVQWQAFTRAVIFKDGILLFRGPKLLNWIPFSGLIYGLDSVDSFKDLVKEKLDTKTIGWGQ